MLVWARTGVVLAISVLLMGSKIVIQVPEGGSVISSTGLYGCAAGEVCTIDVNEQYFAETFTAEAEPGFEFSGWGEDQDLVCGGSQSPYCSELDNGPFSDFDGPEERLRHGGVVKMSPSFAISDYAASVSKPRFRISSHHSTRYYRVRGTSQEEIWAQLHGAANPLPVDRAVGTRPLGHASFQYQYNYRSGFAATAASCRVESGTFKFRYETVLPQLAEAGQISEHLKSRWLPFQALITEHEAGHHAIYRRLVTQLPLALTALGALPCSELDDRVKRAVENTVGAIRRASAEYDEHHGGESYAVSSL